MVHVHSSIQGIPCLLEVTHYVNTSGQGPQAASDIDCYGEHEVEFEVCDRRGRPAPWLERKMTYKDLLKVYKDIDKAFE